MTGRRAAALLAVGMALAGCGTVAEGATGDLAEVATVEDGPDGAVITVSEAAEQRLGLATEPVTTGPAGPVIPYAALLYDVDGATYVFVRTEPLTYLRTPVTVAGKTGDQVALTDGPPAGTEVVTVGGAELVGIETGIDGEE